MLESTKSTASFSASAVQFLTLYDISGEELDLIKKVGVKVADEMDTHITAFYEWLETQPDFALFFSSPEHVERVKALQTKYWRKFFSGVVDEDYLAQRRIVGETHARIGLSLSAYFAAMNVFQKLFLDSDALTSKGVDPRTTRAITKLMHLDTAIVVETFSVLTNQKISEQSEALVQMSTPVTAIWEGILLLPIVGVIDSKRSQDIMEAMLTKISDTQSKVIILDISGVAVVDTAVANHLIKISRATSLMGCECVISGISPAIARTIVELGIDVGSLRTTSTLKDSLSYAFAQTGIQL